MHLCFLAFSLVTFVTNIIRSVLTAISSVRMFRKSEAKFIDGFRLRVCIQAFNFCLY